MYFKKGAAGRRLDRFLTFFQAYLLAKDPLPLDVEFDVQVRGLGVAGGWWGEGGRAGVQVVGLATMGASRACLFI